MSAAIANGNGLIPNSFQTPNLFVDRAMGLLKPEEYVCLSFAIRHILGWQDKAPNRRARISLDYFEHGNQAELGGCGLSRPKISRSLKALDRFGLLKCHGGAGRIGQEWELPLDDSKVNWTALEQRKSAEQTINQKRVRKAVKASAKKRSSTAVVPVDKQYDGRTSTSTAVVPINGTAVVHTKPIDQTHLQTHKAAAAREMPEDVAVQKAEHDALMEQARTLSEEKGVERPNAFKLYEELAGGMTAHIAEQIGAAIDDYTAEWVEAAIKVAMESNGRTWRYVKAILDRWKREGKDDGKSTPNPSARRTVPDAGRRIGSAAPAHEPATRSPLRHRYSKELPPVPVGTGDTEADGAGAL